jgi:hypothetical protein
VLPAVLLNPLLLLLLLLHGLTKQLFDLAKPVVSFLLRAPGLFDVLCLLRSYGFELGLQVRASQSKLIQTNEDEKQKTISIQGEKEKKERREINHTTADLMKFCYTE